MKRLFDGINMTPQRRKEKDLLSFALDGPLSRTGKDMLKARANFPGLRESHFNVTAENLIATLKDLKISQEPTNKVVAAVAPKTMCLAARSTPRDTCWVPPPD